MTYIPNGDFEFDAIVVGAGHAGIEAGLALARTGCKTVIFSITLDNIGYLACNPSIGGTAKGHLVREIDALGGQMGITADATLTQLRMLNSSKGPAVHSLRAQIDKYKYHYYMKDVLENEPNLTLRQGEVKEIIVEDNVVKGIKTVYDMEYRAKTVILACGVYLKACIIVGEAIENKGPVSFNRSNYLSENLAKHGLEIRRFKTGTPARVHKDSIDISKLEIQYGEEDLYSFSVMSNPKKVKKTGNVCWLGYTNEQTHEVIRDNIMLAPKYNGMIDGIGPRYCPSIEDKVMRFTDKNRHQFFLEPEGDNTKEMYVQGISTSLPASVQYELYRTIEGFEKIHIMRDAYAIEYDCINPLELYPTLEHKKIKNLFFAGQINGTSGYEEAGAQGLVAGLNASLTIRGKEKLVFTRDNSYIGVLIDDLVTEGTNEPYRMMTSRAEFRLTLRQDNADVRLTEIGRKAGLVSDKRYRKFKKKLKELDKCRELANKVISPKLLVDLFAKAGENLPQRGLSVKEIIRRNGVTKKLFCEHFDFFNDCMPDTVEQIFTEIKYEGYLARAEKMREDAKKMENEPLSTNFDYSLVSGLRLEAQEKLNKIKPLSIGQASRISGVSPADVNVLIMSLPKLRKKGE